MPWVIPFYSYDAVLRHDVTRCLTYIYIVLSIYIYYSIHIYILLSIYIGLHLTMNLVISAFGTNQCGEEVRRRAGAKSAAAIDQKAKPEQIHTQRKVSTRAREGRLGVKVVND